MKRVDSLKRLKQAGIVAVVRGASRAEALASSKAVVAGGITAIELTFTVPEAESVIRELVAYYQAQPEVIIGAGTVLDATTARMAIMAGADFIVSPTFNQATAELCNLYQIPYLPGCMTITEIQTALISGVDIVKLFPGGTFGPSIIANYKAPFPYVNIMPSGGVSLDNMADWFAAGAVAVGVGGNLLAPAASGDFEAITALATQYADKLTEIRS